MTDDIELTPSGAADTYLKAAIKAVCDVTRLPGNLVASPELFPLIVAHMNAAASHARTQAIANLAEVIAEFCEMDDE